MTVDEQFNILNEKLQLLLKQHARLQRETDKLKEEIKGAQKREAAALSKLDDVQQQVAVLKLAAGEMTDKDKKQFDRKLAQYIKEIDRAIAYLSQ